MDTRSGNTTPLVSVLIPAYNEAAMLEASLEDIHAYLLTIAGRYRSEIVVVDDGSSDQTGAIAESFSRRHAGVRVIRHPVNLGLGQAMRTGFGHAAGDYIVTLDSDLSYDTDHIARMVDTLIATRAEVAVASPYMKGGKVTGVPSGRALLSRVANRFLAFFAPQAGVQTLTGMVRAYDGRFLRALNLRALGVDINTEILYKALLLRGRIVQVPAHLDWTRQNRSAIARISSFKVLRGVLTYVLAGFIFRPFMFFVMPAAVLFLIAAYIAVWLGINLADIYQHAPPGDYWDDRLSVSFATLFRERPHAVFAGGIVAVLSMQLFSLGFMAYQAKRYFEELFHLSSGIRERIVSPSEPSAPGSPPVGGIVAARDENDVTTGGEA